MEIDNNTVENSLRPTAIGKKNWLFIGDAEAGQRCAILYTLMSNCHREAINAEANVTDHFTRLPTQPTQTVHRLTPKVWATDQRALNQPPANNCGFTG